MGDPKEIPRRVSPRPEPSLPPVCFAGARVRISSPPLFFGKSGRMVWQSMLVGWSRRRERPGASIVICSVSDDVWAEFLPFGVRSPSSRPGAIVVPEEVLPSWVVSGYELEGGRATSAHGQTESDRRFDWLGWPTSKDFSAPSLPRCLYVPCVSWSHPRLCN